MLSKDRTYWSPWQQGVIDFHGNRWCSSGCISCNKMTPPEACLPLISIFCYVLGGGKINLNGLTFVFWNKWTYFDMAINQAVWLKSLPETDCWIPWRLMLESLPVTRFEQKQTDWSPSGGITDCLMGRGGGVGGRENLSFFSDVMSVKEVRFTELGDITTLYSKISLHHIMLN